MSWRLAVKVLARMGSATSRDVHFSDMAAFPLVRNANRALRDARAQGLVTGDAFGAGRALRWRLTERGAAFVAGRVRPVDCKSAGKTRQWVPVCERCGR